MLLLLLAGAVTEFLIRGPLRLWHGTEWNDFLSPYIQSRLWIQGADPYAAENFVRLWPAGKPMFTFVMRDAADGKLVAKRGVPSPYPITSFVVLSVLALGSWDVAEFLWIVLSLGAVGILICGIVAINGVGWRDPKAWMFATYTFALAPIHTGLATQNPAMVVVALCVATVWAERRARENLAALLLALAICVKPQLGLCVLLFYFVRRQWRMVWVTSGLSGCISLIAIGRMWVAGTAWLFPYIDNSRRVFASGAINDFSGANPVWFHMLNLQVALSPLGGMVRWTNFLAVGIGVALAGTWLWLTSKSVRTTSPLLSLSTLAVISLLPIYHRSYDAALLVFPLGWALLQETHLRTIVHSSLALIALFLAPGGTLVAQLAELGHISANTTNSWYWRSFIAAHQVWALLLLSTLLLWAMAKSSAEPASTEIETSSLAEFAVSGGAR